MLSIEDLSRNYTVALSKLASALGVEYDELFNFCGSIADGAFGARRLKEFFRNPEISEMLDQIVAISEQYRHTTLEVSAS